MLTFAIKRDGESFAVEVGAGDGPGETIRVEGFEEHAAAAMWVLKFIMEQVNAGREAAAQKAVMGAALLEALNKKKDEPQ